MKEPRIVLAGRPALSKPGARLACIVSPLRDAKHAETEARLVSICGRKERDREVPLDLVMICDAAPGACLVDALAAFVGEDEVRS